MRDRLTALLYIVLVVGVSVTHDLRLLAGCAAALVAASLPLGLRPVRRSLLAVGFFTGLVSIAWLVTTLPGGQTPWAALARLNLRAFVLTSLTFLAGELVDVRSLTAGHPRLRTFVVLNLAQVGGFRRLLGDFRLAARSRTCRRPTVRESVTHGAAVGATFLRRAEHAAAELTQGMTSRGFFLDPGGKSEP